MNVYQQRFHFRIDFHFVGLDWIMKRSRVLTSRRLPCISVTVNNAVGALQPKQIYLKLKSYRISVYRHGSTWIIELVKKPVIRVHSRIVIDFHNFLS